MHENSNPSTQKMTLAGAERGAENKKGLRGGMGEQSVKREA